MTNNLSDPMIGWFQMLQRGKKYMKTWPLDRHLAPIFAENRVVNMTLFGIRFMPPLAIFTLTWQIALGGQLAPAIATAFFACSFPLQGLWWLGKRSMMPLPLTLLQWFHSVRQKLSEAGKRVVPVETTPTYQSLAELLKSAFGQLDETFFEDL